MMRRRSFLRGCVACSRPRAFAGSTVTLHNDGVAAPSALASAS